MLRLCAHARERSEHIARLRRSTGLSGDFPDRAEIGIVRPFHLAQRIFFALRCQFQRLSVKPKIELTTRFQKLLPHRRVMAHGILKLRVVYLAEVVLELRGDLTAFRIDLVELRLKFAALSLKIDYNP